jgi:hypothetical protein
MKADNPIFGDERNEYEVRKWYRNNDHSQPSSLLEFHAAPSTFCSVCWWPETHDYHDTIEPKRT